MSSRVQVGERYMFHAMRHGAGDYGQEGAVVTVLSTDEWSAYDKQRTWQVRLPNGRSMQMLESELVPVP